MLQPSHRPARDTDPFARLREATAPAHAELEARLDLLRPPLSQARFAEVLARFAGFHAVWEPALIAVPELASLFEGRSRRATLELDLRRLGRSGEEVAALPACLGATALVASPAAALGSLYVMEGSTLGGKVISRELAAAPWRPAEGLGYFDPYGARTGEMWRELKRRMLELARADAWPEVENGANRTFALLTEWLDPGQAEDGPAPGGLV